MSTSKAHAVKPSADEADQGVAGEDSDHVGAAAGLRVQPLLRVVRPDPHLSSFKSVRSISGRWTAAGDPVGTGSGGDRLRQWVLLHGDHRAGQYEERRRPQPHEDR